MTDRKPPGVPWESYVDRQIRDAEERGAFESLPGKGKPIADLDGPYDELWWVKQQLRRENVSLLPSTLALRKEVEDAFSDLAAHPSERAVLEFVADLNARIVAVNKAVTVGPPSRLLPFNADLVVRQWREQREARTKHS